MKNNLPQIFKFEEKTIIRTIISQNEMFFVAKDIANALEYSWKGISTIQHVPEEWRGVYSVETPSGIQQMLCLSEAGLFFFINRSDKTKALPFQKWLAGTVLPTIRKTGSFSINNTNTNTITKDNYETTKAHLDLELFALEKLKCSESSMLIVTHKVYEDHGVSTKNLPAFTENTRVTFSAKDLLKKNNCGISSVKFNKYMLANGFLEEKERSSTNGKNGVKKFKALTEAGLKYGQNDTSKHNPRETQPHYFEDTFMELFNIINPQEELELA